METLQLTTTFRVRKHRRWLTLVLLITASQIVSTAQSTSKCKNSTIEEAWGPEYASQARSFFATLQRVVESNDSAKFARLIHYPVRLSGAHVTKITRPSELIRKYSSIMTSEMRKAILAQTPECLFANGQGVMIGNGQIWFQQDQGGKFKIITINVMSP